MTELIQVVSDDVAITPGATWMPTVGEEVLRFLDRVHADAREKTKTEAVKILARGIRPGEERATAGLVCGYVQSGKTTSFTAVTALGRDNGFGLVIIVAGTSVNLLEQTQKRLSDDLRLTDPDAYRRWSVAKSPRPGSEEATKMRAALEDWLDPYEDDAATVLVTVMKQHDHLSWLGDVLEEIADHVDLATVPTLIIDDEADQASPNIKKREGEESTTYARIRRIRSVLPAHTLLEYTATPQATLLLSLVDELSPEYVTVIDPGYAYTGGKHFLQDDREGFVRDIPAHDVAAIDESTEPPRSLVDAFATFMLGCAAGRMEKDGPAQRSMLVHPSHKTLPHAKFTAWLKGFRDTWQAVLKGPEDDPDRRDLIEGILHPAYVDLASTVAEIPDAKELFDRLPRVLAKTTIQEVNAVRGRADPVEWSTGYSWILVGGQLMDRGFTVEGLTVTYMPRGLGVGNADTIQQRARFFGYKRQYAGYCRAWLDPEVTGAFTSYVHHEEAMRKELISVAHAGMSLKDWKRTFLLSKKMKLTRANVIRLPMQRESFGGKWSWQGDFDSFDPATLNTNRDLFDAVAASSQFVSDPGDHRRLPHQIHPMRHMPLTDVLELLLNDYVMVGEDSDEFAALRLLLAVAADEGDETCRVHLISHGAPERRRRSVKQHTRIKNLFQGSNKRTGYPGDREIFEEELVTLQLHRVDLMTDDGTDEGDKGQLLLADAPVLAVRVPERLDMSVVVQKL